MQSVNIKNSFKSNVQQCLPSIAFWLIRLTIFGSYFCSNMSTNTVEIMYPSEFNSSTITIPQWLDKTFLEEHLRNYYKNTGIQVANFSVKPAVGKGENYFSRIYRVNVTFSDFNGKNGDVSNW